MKYFILLLLSAFCLFSCKKKDEIKPVSYYTINGERYDVTSSYRTPSQDRITFTTASDLNNAIFTITLNNLHSGTYSVWPVNGVYENLVMIGVTKDTISYQVLNKYDYKTYVTYSDGKASFSMSDILLYNGANSVDDTVHFSCSLTEN